MGYAVECFVDYLALAGDTTDNVPGVPSVGPKTAAQLLGAFKDVEGIYEHIEELTPRQDLFWHNKIQLMLSQRLVTLKRDVRDLPNPHGFLFRRDSMDRRWLAAYCRSNDQETLARYVEAS